MLYYAIAVPWRRRWQQRVREWGCTGHPARILHAKFRQYMLNFGDIARMGKLDRSRFRLSGQRYLHAAAGRGAVLVSIHMGNWELAGAGLALYGVPVTVLAWPSRNPYIERMQLKRRGAYGTRTAYPGVAGVAELLRTLDQGGQAGLMLDVNLPGEGLAVSFLGRTVYLSPLCLLLALRTGAPLLPVLTFRQRDGRCRIILLPPCRPGGRACLQQDLQRLAQVFEKAVRRHPDQYHWLKQK